MLYLVNSVSQIVREPLPQQACFVTKTNEQDHDIELCSQAIRGHWSVENNLRWHLDYSLGEDENTTIDKTAFNNLSLINKMVLSLCKLTRPLMKKGTSIRSMRKMYGWNIEKYLSALLTCFDTDSIVNAMMSSASK